MSTQNLSLIVNVVCCFQNDETLRPVSTPPQRPLKRRALWPEREPETSAPPTARRRSEADEAPAQNLELPADQEKIIGPVEVRKIFLKVLKKEVQKNVLVHFF